jgi:hypothetical protein
MSFNFFYSAGFHREDNIEHEGFACLGHPCSLPAGNTLAGWNESRALAVAGTPL